MSTITVSVSNASFEINSGLDSEPSGWFSLDAFSTQIGRVRTSSSFPNFEPHDGEWYVGNALEDEGSTQTVRIAQSLPVTVVNDGSFNPTSIYGAGYFITDGSSVDRGLIGIRFYDSSGNIISQTLGSEIQGTTWTLSEIKIAWPSNAASVEIMGFLNDPSPGGAGEFLNVGFDSVQNVIIYGTSSGESSGNFPMMTIIM